jgi:nucleoside phosphorylase
MKDGSVDGSKIDIVIVTVNEHEERELKDAFTAGQAATLMQGGSGQSYIDFGMINNQRIVCAPSLMASFAEGGSFDTVLDALNDFDPSVVLAVGIAWGGKEKSQQRPHGQQIGDVLLSQQLCPSDHKKIQDGRIILRGERVAAEEKLVKHFKNVAGIMQPPINVHSGALLSLETLFDSRPERDAILDACPEAVGGEMEGAGLYKAISFYEDRSRDGLGPKPRPKWLIVKAICDWGYKKDDPDKEKYQVLAAKESARLTFEVIKRLDIRPATATNVNNIGLGKNKSSVKDAHDKKMLIAIYERIHRPTLEHFFHFGKLHKLYDPAEDYFFDVDSIVGGIGFHIYDATIRTHVEEFREKWREALYDYRSYFVEMPNPNLQRFNSRFDIYRDSKALAAHDGFLAAIYKTETTLRQLCAAVLDKYPGFDFDLTDAAAIERHRSQNQKILGQPD